MSDPPLDDAEKALFEQAVRGMQDDLPDDARMRRLERMIAPTLAAPSAPSAPSRSWERGPLRVAAGIAVVVTLGTAWVATHRPEPAASPSDTPPSTSTSPSTSPPASATTTAPAAATATAVVSVDSLPAAPPEPAKPIATTTATPAPSAAAPALTTADDPGDELSLLEEARRSLAKDPAHTLALADTHTKRFRKPALAQERERLAIDALVRLGRRSEAETRAHAFEATYPESAHLARVRALVSPGAVP